MTQSTLKACKAAIGAWQQAFNRQDAAGCATQYQEDAIMEARPMGTFKGRAQIQAFWQQIIDGGYCDVDYTDVEWQKVDDNSYILTSKWTMNKAYGVVHRELWVLQPDGSAKLKEDDFEIQGER
ncbi:nuclear transport factor 2 family protein [Endozoicomonas sp. G2_1]|uniref:YybH family protein n=1 Tax=Endozoicomonas sp. G2_1 TaxID=2821091 RepID=UPI001ADAE599|nr:nuclear transport factor 2 family protein [Endozoicomonas sp. G2_1]MBO9490122.1 nuclear transport factor 2 family protein [Endozoicomonas sp. G2_1]